MGEDLLAMGAFGAVSALIGGAAAFLFNRFMTSLALLPRILLAEFAAVFPAFAIAGFVFLSSGDPVGLYGSMSPDEFLIPFAIQIAIILLITTPVVWRVSRRRPRRHSVEGIFD